MGQPSFSRRALRVKGRCTSTMRLLAAEGASMVRLLPILLLSVLLAAFAITRVDGPRPILAMFGASEAISSFFSPFSSPPSSPPPFLSPILSIGKFLGSGRPAPGSEIIYGITYKNTGDASASNVLITDTLPVGMSFVSYSPYSQWLSYTVDGNVIAWTVPWLSPGYGFPGGYIFLRARVLANVAPGEVLTNTADILGTVANQGTYGDSTSLPLTVLPPASDLEVTQSLRGGVSAPGGVLSYRIAYSNVGAAPASNVLITDTLPSGLTFVSQSSGLPYTVSGDTVVWTSVSVPSDGAPRYIYVTASISDTLLPGVSLANGAVISTDSAEENLDNNRSEFSVQLSSNIIGYIDASTELKELYSPFIALSDVTLSPDVVLDVEPGVRVQFDGPYRLYVYGNIRARGVAEKPILFTGNGGRYWRGIAVNSPLSWELDNVIVEFTTDGALTASSQSYGALGGSLTNSIFRNNIRNGYVVYLYGYTYYGSAGPSYTATSNLIVNNVASSGYANLLVGGTSKVLSNTIRSNLGDALSISGAVTAAYNVICGNSGAGIRTSSTSPVNYNTISGNDTGVRDASYSLSGVRDNNIYGNATYDYYRDSSFGSADASNNWWGTTDASLIAQQVYDYFDNTYRSPVVYVPFANNPISGAPATCGVESAPVVDSVNPGVAGNSVATAITITGANFSPNSTVKLDSIVLSGVTRTSSSSLQVTIPPGMPTGVYTVTVSNPDTLSSSLPNSLTVVQGGQVPPTNRWADYYGTSSTLDGQPLPVGAYVGAYTPDGRQVGEYVVTSVGGYGIMHVYGDDSTTPEIDGAREGEAISFRVNGGPATAMGPDPVAWTANALRRMDLAAWTPTVSSAQLSQSWNLFSFNVRPFDGSIGSVLSPISGRYVAVFGYDGGARSYYPDLPPEMNDLKVMEGTRSYWIKMLAPATLPVTGTVIAGNTPVQLAEGWNLIGYLSPSARTVDDALGSIAGKFLVVMGYELGGRSYYPDLPEDMNDLRTLKPRGGYWIKMAQAAQLVYPGP